MNRNPFAVLRVCFLSIFAVVVAQGCTMQPTGTDTSSASVETAISAPALTPAGGAQCANQDPAAIEVQKAVADVRSLAGLAPLSCDTAAQAAAKAHSDYVATNHSLSHDEQDGKTGYTGASVPDRLSAFHFSYQVSGEVVGLDGSAASILGDRGFMNSVYHRPVFLREENVVLGIGVETGAITIDFGRNASGSAWSGHAVMWPPMNAVNVPPSFTAVAEIPNPIPEGHAIVGSPITLITGAELGNVKVTMVDSHGNKVAGKTITGENDKNIRATEAHFVPFEPLDDNTTYTVTFTATLDDAKSTFTTTFTTR